MRIGLPEALTAAPARRREKLWIVLLALLVVITGAAGAQAQQRVRKNIDTLSHEELRNYIHAVQKVIEISKANPDSTDGMSYFEALHNDLDFGPCEHGRDTFFPWHRAHLYLFEEALRRADPSRTSNVTLPYWDWSEPPTGKRYPAVFEMETLTGPAFTGTELDGVPNPLFHAGRATSPICKTGAPAGCERLPFPRAWVESKLLSIASWPGVGAAGFGGKSNGESSCTQHLESGFGQPEGTAHNTIHDSYVAGDMGDPSRAAQDPIFWSFHAYFDLLWSQWQEMPGHSVDTCPTCKLCGLFRDAAQTERFTVKHVLKTDADLHYSYQYTPPPPAPPGPMVATVARAQFVAHPAADFALSGKRTPDIVQSYDVPIPTSAFERAAFVLNGVKINNRFTYQGNVYLHPKNEPFRPAEASFRQRYLVEVFTMWRGHHHGHAAGPSVISATDWVVDITPQLKSLAQQHGGEAWTLTVALVRRPLQAAKFTAPSAGAAAASPGASATGLMMFDSFNLDIR